MQNNQTACKIKLLEVYYRLMGVNKKIKSLNIVKKQIKMSEKFTFCNGDQFSFSTFSFG